MANYTHSVNSVPQCAGANFVYYAVQALRAGAIITALFSAVIAAAITYDASQGAAACELLHVGTNGVPMSVFTLLQLVCRSSSVCMKSLMLLYAST